MALIKDIISEPVLDVVYPVDGREVFPPILLDGNTVAWYDSQLLSTITKDGSDFVSVWADRLGSGHDLLQAVGANQPLWSSNGILFDGVSEMMQTLTFTLNQPEFIYIVFKQVTWNLLDVVFDGFTNVSGRMAQRTSPTELNVYAGINSSDAGGLAINTLGIVRVLFNEASSKFIINDGTIISGDFGSLNMSGFTIGSKGDGSSFSNIEVKEIIIRKVADGATDEANIYNYLSKKYGI